MRFYNLYMICPVFIQNFICSVKGFFLVRKRINSSFNLYLKEYNKSFSFSEEELLKFQRVQLNNLFLHATKSKFWRERMDLYKINLDNKVDIINELKKLPILTKKEVLLNRDLFLTRNKDKLNEVHTGGTTGSGLTFWETNESLNKQWAIWWRYRNKLGIDLNTWCGWFGGKEVVPSKSNEKVFYRINYFGKQIMFSPFHLSKINAINYCRIIEKKKLKWLHGYPSQLSLLASFMLELNIKPTKSVKIITIGSENITYKQKSIIEKAFDAKVFQHYGLAEKVANISESPEGVLIPDNDFSYLEFVHLEENRYKLIGTNFTNIAFPLIRYDTGDIVILDKDGKIIEIEGRMSDYVTLKNGNRFGPMNLIFKVLSNVIESQLYIKSENEFIFRIVKADNYNSIKEEFKLLKEIEKRNTDRTICFSFLYVDKLPRTNSGKLKLITYN